MGEIIQKVSNRPLGGGGYPLLPDTREFIQKEIGQQTSNFLGSINTKINETKEQLKNKSDISQVNMLQKQIDSFQAEQSEGMTDSGSLELVATRVNSSGQLFPTSTSRISYIENVLDNKIYNLVWSMDLIGLFPWGDGMPTKDNAQNETVFPAQNNDYPFQRYRIKAKQKHKYLMMAKIKGIQVTNVEIGLTIRYGNTATTINTNVPDANRKFKSTQPFDYKQIYNIITFDNPSYNELDFSITLTQPNKDTNWAYKEVMIIDITDLSDNEINKIINGGYFQYGKPIINKTSLPDISIDDVEVNNGILFSKWFGKKGLAIGDSLTVDKTGWQKTVSTIHGMDIQTRAKGGIGIIPMIDGEKTATNPVEPLSVSDVQDKDIIILFGGMNERKLTYGKLGDTYPTQNTLYGKFQYAINKIYDLLDQANNLSCKLLLITPHCAGKYSWANADGYDEFPSGSGQTLELMAEHIKRIGNYNNIRVVDLWHNSGIGRRTWKIYTRSSVPTKTPEPNSTDPFPEYADQLHLNEKGNQRIGDLIASEMNLL